MTAIRYETPLVQAVLRRYGRTEGLAALRLLQEEIEGAPYGDGHLKCQEACGGNIEQWRDADVNTIRVVMEIDRTPGRQVYWDNAGLVIVGRTLPETVINAATGAGLKVGQIVDVPGIGVAGDLVVDRIRMDDGDVLVDTFRCYTTLEQIETAA